MWYSRCVRNWIVLSVTNFRHWIFYLKNKRNVLRLLRIITHQHKPQHNSSGICVSIFRLFQDFFKLWRFPTTFRNSASPAYSGQNNPSIKRDESIFNGRRIESVSNLRISFKCFILCFSIFYSWTWISMDVCRLGSKWTWKAFRNHTNKPACTGAAHYGQKESLSFLTLSIFRRWNYERMKRMNEIIMVL